MTRLIINNVLKMNGEPLASATSAKRYSPCLKKIGSTLAACAVAMACFGDEESNREWNSDNVGLVRIATGGYPPYYDKKMTDGGPVTANIKYACKRAKLNCTFEFGQWEQVPIWLEDNKIDFTYSYSITKDRQAKYVFSKEPVITGHNSIFYRKSAFPKGIYFGEYIDLVGCSMLGISDTWYESEFKRLGVKTKWTVLNEISWVTLGSGTGGVEALVEDTYKALEELRLLGPEFSDVIGDIGFSKQDYSGRKEETGHLMFQKEHFDSRKIYIRDALDATFERLNISKFIENIMAREFAGSRREVIPDKSIVGCNARINTALPLMQQ